MSEFYWSSDYGSKCKNTDCDNKVHDEKGYNYEWCFVATLDNVETVIPYSKLKSKDCDDMFNVGPCLMAGIGLFLSRCKINKID